MPALLNICFLLSFLGAHARRVDGGCRAREEAVMKGVVLGEEVEEWECVCVGRLVKVLSEPENDCTVSIYWHITSFILPTKIIPSI